MSTEVPKYRSTEVETILIAGDHAGFSLKEKLKLYLEDLGFQVEDLGTYSKKRCDYPEYAAKLANQIAQGNFDRGILICKSGIGNSIVANRFRGVRAALCHSTRTAELSRRHNDANILVLGAGFLSLESAKRIVKAWISAEFEGGRHKRRLNQIKKIEKDIKNGYFKKCKNC